MSDTPTENPDETPAEETPEEAPAEETPAAEGPDAGDAGTGADGGAAVTDAPETVDIPPGTTTPSGEPLQENPEQSPDDSVASVGDNEALEHTFGGITTRDDRTDMGVTMLPGDGSEPVGPEDALGLGPKRGDYTGRIGSTAYQPHEVVPVPDAEPGEPQVAVQAQRPRADEIGEEAGLKGGVQTTAAS